MVFLLVIHMCQAWEIMKTKMLRAFRNWGTRVEQESWEEAPFYLQEKEQALMLS